VPVPKEKQSALNTPINAPLPYEMMMPQPVQSQYPMTAQPTMTAQLQQAQQQKQQEKELNKIRRKALIGAVLLFIPIINLIGIGLLFDALIHYLKLRSRS
jgi:hypothetical protein